MREEDKNVAEYLEIVRSLGLLIAHIARVTSDADGVRYREPGFSITELDNTLGSPEDIEGPLLSAHRFGKFYLLGAGDCLYSMAMLLRTDHPNLVGSSAIARSAAEYASRAAYLTNNSITYPARIYRALTLMRKSLNEYKSTNIAGATNLIESWNRWERRVKKDGLIDIPPKQPFGNYAKLIAQEFPGEDLNCYEELSRPTHGNATWLTITVIQEQKGTVVARIQLMRNVMFSVRCVTRATECAASLWGLDLDSIVRSVAQDLGVDETPPDWAFVKQWIKDASTTVSEFDERRYVDATPDPQPHR